MRMAIYPPVDIIGKLYYDIPPQNHVLKIPFLLFLLFLFCYCPLTHFFYSLVDPKGTILTRFFTF